MEPERPKSHASPLTLLSIVIPVRNEERCFASTVEHLDLELRLRSVPHEIVVVDDGSTDSTWRELTQLHERVASLRPVKIPARMDSAAPLRMDWISSPVMRSW